MIRAAAAERAGRQDIARLLALTDGVFAIAITLLVLELRVPPTNELDPDGPWKAAARLLSLWPSLLGYVLSFVGIGIMWHNHCVLFRYLVRANHALMSLNTLLLMLVAFVPFATAMLAEYLPYGGLLARTGALIYNATLTLTALAYNVLWRFGTRSKDLVDPDADPKVLARVHARYRFGPSLYLVATFLALFSVTGSLVVVGLLALFFSLPYGGVPVMERLRRS